MKYLFIVLAIVVALNLQGQSQIEWPAGKKSVIILTYDDALASHLNIAIPQLDSANLKGTFFLNRLASQEHVNRWREAAENNHEIGNHSLFHPCLSSKFEADKHYQAESYSTKNLLDEIATMNNLLFAIDNKNTRTYAYPCGETSIGGNSYIDSLRNYGIKYARGVGNSPIMTNFKDLDVYEVPCMGFPDDVPAEDLINFVKEVQRKNGMAVLIFHGVGGDYLQVSADAHSKLIEYLKDTEEIWVTTFEEGLDYVTNKIE